MELTKKIIILFLIISTLFSVVSCDKKAGNDQDENDITVNDDTGNTGNDDDATVNEDNGSITGLSECTVTVKNPLGKVLSGVTVLLHHDNGTDYNVCASPAVTDEEGKVSFNLDPANKYSVAVMGYPGVYTAKSGSTPNERYGISAEAIDVVLLPKVNYAPTVYRAGDYMADFTITDIDGNTYNLYDLLSEKRAVVLNFWFYSCPPCANEFPALNASYNTHKDSIEVLAIDDYPNDTVDRIRGYEQYRGFTLDMPLFKSNYQSALSITRFATDGWPTTVIIDRYGVISTIHVGAITSSSRWDAIFDYYISDNYNGTPYNG